MIDDYKQVKLLDAILAGVFIGIGGIFMLSVGAMGDLAYKSLVMGLCFSISLLMIIYNDALLFTGRCATYWQDLCSKKMSLDKVIFCLCYIWIANLIGTGFMVFLYHNTGLSDRFIENLNNISSVKVNLSVNSLIFKSILCNMIVCLAILVARNFKSYGIKALIIIFCVTAFVVSGFEHSIANMFILGLAFKEGLINVFDFLYNISLSTLGNIIGGVIIAVLMRFKQYGNKLDTI